MYFGDLGRKWKQLRNVLTYNNSIRRRGIGRSHSVLAAGEVPTGEVPTVLNLRAHKKHVLQWVARAADVLWSANALR